MTPQNHLLRFIFLSAALLAIAAQAASQTLAPSPSASDGSAAQPTPASRTSTAADANPFISIGVDVSGLWGDFDNDGDLDIIGPTIFRNDGGGTFVDVGQAASGQLADWNHDGYLDVLPSDGRLFQNLGTGAFAEHYAFNTYSYIGYVYWGDNTNDGNLDALYAGCGESDWISLLYHNNTIIQDTLLFRPGAVYPCSKEVILGAPFATWGDYDSDGDLDIVATLDIYPSDVVLLRNDTDVGFATIPAFDKQGLDHAAWGDYDNDGDLVVFLLPLGLLYRNEGDDNFIDIGAALTYGMHAAWGDYDNDGDLDIAIDEGDLSGNGSIYRNDGSGTFLNIGPAFLGAISWGDYDNDGDLDLLGDGAVYRNESSVANSPPSVPGGLMATAGPLGTTFSWTSSGDAETPAAGLTYNLRVGTTPGGNEIQSALADVGGHLRVPALGNVYHNQSWTMLLPLGTYYWSVQAVDAGFMGSPFAPEQTITVATTATQLALVSAQAEPDRVRLAWYAASAPRLEATLYRRTADSPWRALGTIGADGTGRISYEDRQVVPGRRYGYRLGVIEGGQEEFLGETWVEVPLSARWALEGLRPNPATRDLTVGFSLPASAPAQLDLVDVTGRLIMSRQVGTLGAGNHVVRLTPDEQLAPGVYLLRLTQSGRSLVARAVVMR